MCGIIGATGDSPVAPSWSEGLRRLEYRGYDSAAIALPAHGTIWRRRRAGGTQSIAALGEGISNAPPDITCGIGHSRWATHGAPSESNAHPHTDASGRLAIIHNGIIENFRELTLDLPRRGAELVSDTDTEVLGHLIAAREEHRTEASPARRRPAQDPGDRRPRAVPVLTARRRTTKMTRCPRHPSKPRCSWSATPTWPAAWMIPP